MSLRNPKTEYGKLIAVVRGCMDNFSSKVACPVYTYRINCILHTRHEYISLGYETHVWV